MIRQRLKVETLVFLTQDLEFLVPPDECKAAIVVSRVPRSLPIRRRTEIWEQVLVDLAATPLVAAVYEIFESGSVVRVN